MMALSVREPWIWFILHAGKRFENRRWPDAYARAQFELCPPGSNFWLHAAKGCTRQEFDEACKFAAERCHVTKFPNFDTMKRGGYVGIAKFVGAVTKSRDPWFVGPIGLKLSDVLEMPFVPAVGRLGFFEANLTPEPEQSCLSRE